MHGQNHIKSAPMCLIHADCISLPLWLHCTQFWLSDRSS